MYKVSTSKHIIKGSFLLWSIIGAIFIGLDYILIGILFSYFCVDKEIFQKDKNISVVKKNVQLIIIFTLIIILILNIPNIIETFKNFFSSSNVEKFIENANSNIGKGRSIIEIVISALAILPMIILDITKDFKRKYRILLTILILLLLLTFSGTSRGLLSIFLISVFLPNFKKIYQLIIFGIIFLIIYTVVSFIRDGYNPNFLIPLIDSFAFPGYNLSLLYVSGPHLYFMDYIYQTFMKLVPSFIYDKHIFSFNIEMTKTIYPFMKNYVDSVSVFTYLGDFITYKPLFLMLIFNILIIRILTSEVYKIILKYDLKITSLFIALFYITSLRSRISDLISFLLLYFIILFLFDLLNRITWNSTNKLSKLDAQTTL